MLRYTLSALVLSLGMSAAQAASLNEITLNKTLEQVAKQSSVNTPRAINEDILDQGYTVQGTRLINHLSVRSEHASEMRANPDVVRAQLAASVCANSGFRQLLGQGAQLHYQFTEYRSNRPVITEVFQGSDCGL